MTLMLAEFDVCIYIYIYLNLYVGRRENHSDRKVCNTVNEIIDVK